MNKNIGYSEDISALLYEITDVYEKKIKILNDENQKLQYSLFMYEKEIKILNDENQKLQYLLSTNVFFRVANKCWCGLKRLKIVLKQV